MRRLRATAACALGALGLALAQPLPAPPAGASPLQAAEATDRRAGLVVRFFDSASASTRERAHDLAGGVVTGRIPALDVVRVSAPAGGVAAYATSPGVMWAEPEPIPRITDMPNDPLLAYQWPLDRLSVFRAWRRETGTRSAVTVAVADTGVDPSHPDLEGRVSAGVDFVNRDQDPRDDHLHGTHVAGVIAANVDNREGIAGLSWGADVLPLKVCNAQGACPGFEVAAGIVYAALEGAEVVNLSLGGPGPSCPRIFSAAAELARARGTLLVAAAGNAADRGNPVSYPVACPGYLGVGATDATDHWASFSNYGRYVDVSAPGVAVMSTVPPEHSEHATPGYARASGTSMAAPHVSGLAALLFSLHPDWSPGQVQRRIEKTAADRGPRGRDPFYGAGRINVRKALATR